MCIIVQLFVKFIKYTIVKPEFAYIIYILLYGLPKIEL